MATSASMPMVQVLEFMGVTPESYQTHSSLPQLSERIAFHLERLDTRVWKLRMDNGYEKGFEGGMLMEFYKLVHDWLESDEHQGWDFYDLTDYLIGQDYWGDNWDGALNVNEVELLHAIIVAQIENHYF